MPVLATSTPHLFPSNEKGAISSSVGSAVLIVERDVPSRLFLLLSPAVTVTERKSCFLGIFSEQKEGLNNINSGQRQRTRSRKRILVGKDRKRRKKKPN